MSGALTETERACLVELELHYGAFGEFPNYEVLCRELGFKSKNSVHRLLRSLARRGYVEMPENNHFRAKLLKTIDGLPVPPAFRYVDDHMVRAKCWLFEDGELVRTSDALVTERRL